MCPPSGDITDSQAGKFFSSIRLTWSQLQEVVWSHGCSKDSRGLLFAFGNNYVGGRIVDLKVGNTETAARIIQELTGAALFRIDTVQTYPLDYEETTRVAQTELRQKARPELRQRGTGLEGIGTIILGYPNWWGTMPMAVCTFLESLDFTGKVILPLCTHEGSGLGHSVSDIRKTCPGAKVLDGLAIVGGKVGGSKSAIQAWLKSAGVIA